MKTTAGTDKQQRGPAILSRIGNALSFARLAVLFGKSPARAEAKPQARRAEPPAVMPSAKRRASAPPPAPAARPTQASPKTAVARDAAAEGRRQERARWAAIIMSEHGQRNPQLAAKLADTDVTVKEALAVLELTPAAPRGSFLHPDRAARNPQIAAAGVPSVPPAHAAAARMDRAMAEALPRTAHTEART